MTEPKYGDPAMESYFRSLPPDVQGFISQSGAKVSSLGELMMIGEHFRISFGHDPTQGAEPSR